MGGKGVGARHVVVTGHVVVTIPHFAGELAWGVDETLAQLETALHLFRSGQYLQNSTSSRAGE